MTSRRSRHLSAPPPPALLRDRFPARTLPAGAALLRCHHRSRRPWWFSSDGGGRFDLAAPAGTCYLAEDEVVTLLETWGGLRIVPSYLAEERVLSELACAEEVKLADLTSNHAAAFGVTAEIFTTVDYTVTQQWAAALHASGYGGVRYWARHDLAHGNACVAVFGSAGEPLASGRAAAYDIRRTEPLGSGNLLTRLQDQTGIAVLPLPYGRS